MIKPMPWMGRSFSFGLAPGTFPMVLERLRGTPTRATEMVAGLPEATLAEPHQGGWSVKEHIGHLADLDELDQQRLGELLAQTATLSAEDRGNRKTEAAAHAKRPIWIVIDQLREDRARLVERLDALGAEEIERSATHSRLGLAMRVIDWAQLVAEHDDHHLAHARWVLTALRSASEGAPRPDRVRVAGAPPR